MAAVTSPAHAAANPDRAAAEEDHPRRSCAVLAAAAAIIAITRCLRMRVSVAGLPDSRFGPHSLIGGVLATHLSDCVIKFSTIQENESDEVEKY